MKQGILKFSKEFITPIGLKEWVGIEYPIDFDTEEPFEVYEQARVIVEGYQAKKHAETMPFNLASGPVTTILQTEKPIPEDQRIAALISDIYTCTELKILESYKFIAKSDPRLQAAYDEMIKKLSK